MKKYSLTEEHRAQLKPWADKWIANAMSTAPMTEEEKEICRDAVEGLYRAADLVPPPRHRIVFVSSPFILRFASGFAAAIWHLRGKNKKSVSAATNYATDAATRAATRAATYAATDAATDAATSAATDAATDDATYDATYAATDDATYDATSAATDAATYDATNAATDDAKNKWFKFDVSGMRRLAAALKLGEFGLKCAEQIYWRCYHGGNQWSAWSSFLTFFRHVVQLKLDYSKFDHWEKLAIHSGPRIMHKEFCMISDRPKTLLVNALNQPHCEDGPFCEWRDGSALFALNGVRVPEWIVTTPKDKFTRDMILKEQNADYRREIVRKLGNERMVEVLKPKIADKEFGYELYMVELGDNRERPFLRMTNPSINTVHIEGVGPDCKTVREAICYRNSLKKFALPATLDGLEMYKDCVGTYHQQGDLLAFPVDSIPSDAKERMDKVVVEGLNRHIAIGDCVKVYDGYVSSSEPFAIQHPEHKDTVLSAGNYQIKQVLEYDHWKNESREVID